MKAMGLALMTGVLFALALPPFSQEWLGWLAIAPLLFAAQGRRPLEAVGLGLLAGALCGIIHVGWHHNADTLRFSDSIFNTIDKIKDKVRIPSIGGFHF